MTWDNVELIRNAQTSAKERFAATSLATHDEIQKAVNTEVAKGILAPRISEVEQMIFKIRSEMIDYIVAHGLVDGLILDGVLQPVENGKIVITSELIRTITEKLGYFDEGDVRRFIEKYLPEHSYVADEGYTHTDNNYTTPEKNKLAGVADGAEVNKVIDVIFNGVSVLDDGTRVATITITPEDVKRWYESNPDTNTFTDAQKAKLAGISDGAEVNRVDDVLIDGRSVLADDKKAKITPEDIKKAYEKNPDTNAFTDAEKTKLAGIASGATVSKVDNVTLDGTTVVDAATKTAKLTAAAIKKSYESNADTNAFTDAEKNTLEALKTWKPTAEGDIADNAAGVSEAKQSISELGNEVNSVEGRVTTLETSAVRDVLLNGKTTVDTKTHKSTITAAGIKAAYESNSDTNAFTDAEKTKLAGITSGATVSKVDNVTLDGTTVVDDATKTAKLTAAAIKKSYESNADTNAFTDAEKNTLEALKTWKPTAEGDIADNAAGVSEAKQSISELGNEVNSVEGRVTTLETSAVRDVLLNGKTTVDTKTHKSTITAAGIKAAYESNSDTNAFTDAEKTKLAGITSGATVSKVDNVTLDGTTVVDDATKTAKLTAAAIKKSYESNADTNAFTDAEKTKLAALPLITLSGPSHNAYYRGENLGTTVTAEQLNAIKSGSFADLFIGDYWVLNGVKWTIAQFDRYYVNYANSNNPAARKHHVTVVNETPIGTIEFNTNDWSTGGFVSSNVRTAAIESVTPIVTAAFGDNITPVGLYEWSGLNASGEVTGEWTTETIIVPSSAQVVGVETVGLEDTPGGYTFDDTGRMPLFQYAPYERFLTNDGGASVVYPLRSARVSRSGNASTLQGLAIGAWGDVFTPTPSITQAGQFRVMVNIAKED